jgi:SdrD B-like domain
MNWIKTNYFANKPGLRLFSMLGFILILNSSFGQCYRIEGQELTFSAAGQNSNSAYSTTYVLTDYQGTIKSISSAKSFGLQPKGLYKIYGVNYATQSGLDSLIVGSSIDSLQGTCFDVSQPFEALVCSNTSSLCQTTNGKYSFQSTGDSSNLNRVYVLTDLTQSILQISDTTYFTGISTGEFLIFPINFNLINQLEVGQNIKNLTSICCKIGNPIVLKSCQACSVNAGNDIELCISQTIYISAMGSGAGTYKWSDGQSGRSIYYTPTATTTLMVTFTDSSGCTAIDDVFINLSSNLVANAGENQTIKCGEQAIITATSVPTATYKWSGGQTTQSISVTPLQTTTYYVTITIGDCHAVDEVTIFVNPANEPIRGDTLICSGQSTILYACDGTHYKWSTNDSTSFINVNPTSTQTYTVTVTKGNGCLSVDTISIYVKICGKIGDLVWEDINGNGTKELQELGIVNVEVKLFRNGVQHETTFTDPTGMYFFTNLEPGNYTLRFKTPDGFVASAQDIGSNDFIDSDVNPLNGLTPTYTVAENYTNYTIDAGFYRLAEIGDLVWEDRNRNGLKDDLESGIANIEVRLQGNDGSGSSINLTTFTDSSGHYLFSNLSPGQYTITFVKPGEYTFSPKDVGTDETKDSDSDTITGTTSVIMLNSGDRKLWIDAGMYKCFQIGDFVWLDSGPEQNVQDAGDNGINGVIIQLFKSSDPNNIIQTDTSYSNEITGLSGFYNFKVCETGTYFIKVLVGSEYKFVLPKQGSSDNKDSDIIDEINGTSMPFAIGDALNCWILMAIGIQCQVQMNFGGAL